MTKNDPNHHNAMEILEPLYISAPTKPFSSSSNNNNPTTTPNAVSSSYDVTPIIVHPSTPPPPTTTCHNNDHYHHDHPYNQFSKDTNTEITALDTLGFSPVSCGGGGGGGSGTTVSSTTSRGHHRYYSSSYSKVWNRRLNTLVYLVRNQRQKRKERRRRRREERRLKRLRRWGGVGVGAAAAAGGGGIIHPEDSRKFGKGRGFGGMLFRSLRSRRAKHRLIEKKGMVRMGPDTNGKMAEEDAMMTDWGEEAMDKAEVMVTEVGECVEFPQVIFVSDRGGDADDDADGGTYNGGKDGVDDDITFGNNTASVGVEEGSSSSSDDDNEEDNDDAYDEEIWFPLDAWEDPVTLIDTSNPVHRPLVDGRDGGSGDGDNNEQSSKRLLLDVSNVYMASCNTCGGDRDPHFCNGTLD